MNEQNLIPFTQRSEAEVREANRKGGINSGKARLAKKHGRELVRALLACKEPDPRIVQELAAAYGIAEKDVTKEVAMHGRQVEKAIRKADTNAYKAVQQAAGYQDPDAAGGATFVVHIDQATAEAVEKWTK